MVAQPTSLSHAIGLAKLYEDKYKEAKRQFYRPEAYKPPSGLSKSMLPPLLPTPPKPTSTQLPIKRLSAAERQARREKGLCYNCDEKFSPGHKCQGKQFLLLFVDEDSVSNSVHSDDEFNCLEEVVLQNQPEISFQALAGHTSPKTLRIHGLLQQMQVNILIDSGSTHNFIQDRVASFLNLPIQHSPNFNVTIGNGDFMKCQGFCPAIPISIQGNNFPIDFYVLPMQGTEIVLGVQWLELLGPITLDYSKMTMSFTFKGEKVTLQGANNGAIAQLQLHQLRRDINTKFIASFYHLVLQDNTASSSAVVHEDLELLLMKFSSVFDDPVGLPPARPQDHQVHLVPGAKPTNVRPYKYPHFQKAEIERQVQQMLKEGIIQLSTSPFSSPVLLVKKKDGAWRFCVDYRALNAVTVKDKFPIPTAEELFDELHDAVFFSKLDLRSGYHQIRVKHEDIAKTTFRTHEGHYEFLVMPFGLTNAPSTFQAIMNQIFKPYLRQFVLVFFDDILVFSATWHQHLKHVETVLQVLKENQFVAKRSKCSFGQTSIEYLGHIVSHGCLKADPTKLAAMQQWPSPASIKQLRAFLGLTGYYRKFVQSYAAVAAPLTELLKKDNFQWTDKTEEAFIALKHKMTSVPVLALPNFNLPFELETDASGVSIGAVLAQNKHPISFFSKKMSLRMQSASVYIREMYAITESVKKWRQYLLGREFMIFTDHQSLHHILTQVIQTPEQQKWVSKLAGYHYKVIYKPGKQNNAADALSRAPHAELSTLQSSSGPHFLLLDELRKEYGEDTYCKELLQQLEHAPSTLPHYSVRDGIVLYKNRILVPEQLRQALMQEFHAGPLGGHAGIARSVARLKATFYWKHMKHDIKKFVQECKVCQQVKYETSPMAGLLQPLPIPQQIWEDIAMDFIVGLPSSNGKSAVMVVVDRLSKYGHFIPLPPAFSALKVAELFLQHIFKLHGLPKTVVSDRDPLFLSSFWKELFTLQGTKLCMSSAYHPQSDGQTEVLNRILEQYLRCFVSDEPKQWVKYLPLAEFWYNTAYHTATALTPFEVVYGRKPPSLVDYVMGTSLNTTVDEELTRRKQTLQKLKMNLVKAQERMKKYSDLHRSDRVFQEGDWVFVKLQPYRQHSVANRSSHKLAKRYFGPFKVIKRVGEVAYKLDLPEGARIHPVFHVSLLKQCRGDQIQGVLPEEAMLSTVPAVSPVDILGSRVHRKGSRFLTEVLVCWAGLPKEEATWEDLEAIRRSFPSFNLEDKVRFNGGGNDSNPREASNNNNKRVQQAAIQPEPAQDKNKNKSEAHLSTKPKRNINQPKYLRDYNLGAARENTRRKKTENKAE